jgi:threonine dehydrogenase-like Zn-dependent dehydrogenase
MRAVVIRARNLPFRSGIRTRTPPDGEGLIDVKPLITASMPLEAAVDAFELASDRSKSMKVQLTF